MAAPAHQPSVDKGAALDDFDMGEELSDEQIRELLNGAERRMRAKQASSQTSTSNAPFKLPRLKPGHIADTYLKTEGSVTRLDLSQLISAKDRALADGVKKIEDPVQVKKLKEAEKKATAGPNWFNLPRTELTPELRRDIQLLKMRGVLDPKRHYKKTNSKADVPAYSQVGTVIEGPTEFYNGRLNNKDRKKTFVEEVLAQEQETGRFKRKYNEIQKTKTSGKKAFYKALKAKRQGRVGKR
ncbi:Fcf2-domain-containing protein [Lindgomyces ingoldianus]|uniref:Fcf2-domain-containing protein n=1 Tax=Lindgomyces ingoldianus TaxID=673940 RepID=A0ACB6R6X1_9PLEO|nr:Fcf2-domain-containing protein [Lindgomyces ingoldianus]KAF2474065.1 Fcf2-domain-containing protein [Lindgomyces ingoldianus]